MTSLFFIYIAAVADVESDNFELVVFDAGNDSVVANSIAPTAFKLATQNMTVDSWIFAIYKILNNSLHDCRSNLLIKFA